MKFKFFDSLPTGKKFVWNYQEWEKINDKQGKRLSDGKIKDFRPNDMTFSYRD